MKFYGNGVVWDTERGCALCRFRSGSFETDDARTIKILIAAGFQPDTESKKPGGEISVGKTNMSDAPIDKTSGLYRLTLPQLRLKANIAGLSRYRTWSKEQIIKALEGGKK